MAQAQLDLKIACIDAMQQKLQKRFPECLLKQAQGRITWAHHPTPNPYTNPVVWDYHQTHDRKVIIPSTALCGHLNLNATNGVLQYLINETCREFDKEGNIHLPSEEFIAKHTPVVCKEFAKLLETVFYDCSKVRVCTNEEPSECVRR